MSKITSFLQFFFLRYWCSSSYGNLVQIPLVSINSNFCEIYSVLRRSSQSRVTSKGLLLLLQRCFAGQAILEGRSCIEYEFKCALYVYICNVCMSRHLARRQFSYAPMDLLPFLYLPSLILLSFPSSTASPFAAIAPPLCLQIAQRKQCENLFAQHPPPLSSSSTLVIHSYLPLFIPLVIYLLHS